ncbi:MAG: zinc-ribbon domain-containing protein [Lachnospiraceae bacterium]|nr:zinc-ribbon domain-containing protein [Lachnospiraceae bacterium]
MFCQKCGNKLEENVIFCPRCGARQPVDAKTEQAVENAVKPPEQKDEKTVLPPHGPKTLLKVYEQMQKKAALCPEIKSVVRKDSRSWVVVEGKYNQYKILVPNNHNPVSLYYTPGSPLAILITICFVLYIADVLIFRDTLFLAGIWGMAIAVNLYGYRIAAAGCKEKKTVMSFIKDTLELSKYTETPAGFEIFMCSMTMFIGVLGIVCYGMTYMGL